RELQHPGVRVPLTSEPALWRQAVSLGKEILWLHTFGQIAVGSKKDRPRFADFVDDFGPKVIVEIADGPNALPEGIAYDLDNQTLVVGHGRIYPVSQRVWDYDVGGMRVIRHWFNYRSAQQQYCRRSSLLDDETIHGWSSDLTDELLEILAVLERCI